MVCVKKFIAAAGIFKSKTIHKGMLKNKKAWASV